MRQLTGFIAQMRVVCLAMKSRARKNADRGGTRESALQSGWVVEAAATEQPAVADKASEPANNPSGVTEVGGSTAETSPNQLGNLAVVFLGLTGGLYLLYAWVWMSWAQHYAGVNAAAAAGSGTIGGALQQIVFWISPLAPILWFVTALVIHRAHPRKLAIALIIGLIVTLPLPMIFSSGASL